MVTIKFGNKSNIATIYNSTNTSTILFKIHLQNVGHSIPSTFNYKIQTSFMTSNVFNVMIVDGETIGCKYSEALSKIVVFKE